MDINLKSPVSIAKGIGMALVIAAAAVAVIKGAAYLVNLALPGKGELVKSPFRLG